MMLPLSLVLWLVFLHWFGDWFLQTDDQALRKSKDWGALASHVLTVTLVLFTGAAFWYMADAIWWGTGTLRPAQQAVYFTLVNGAAHFVTDAVTSRINARLWFIDFCERPLEDKRSGNYATFTHYAKVTPTRHWFFVSIGFDQVLHYVVLFVTAAWWLA